MSLLKYLDIRAESRQGFEKCGQGYRFNGFKKMNCPQSVCYIFGYILHCCWIDLLTNVAIHQDINSTARVIIDNSIYTVGITESMHPVLQSPPLRT